MKGFFAFLFLVVVLIAPSYLAAAEPKEVKSQELPICDEGKKIGIELGKQRIKFSIPEKYFSPRDIYKKVQNPAELITVQLKKTDMSQNCHEGFSTNKISNQFYRVTIRSNDPYLFPKMIKSRTKIWYPKPNGTEIGKFEVFSSNYTEAKPWERKDLLVPINKKEAEDIFLECVYSLPSTVPTIRMGCGVNSKFNDNLRVRYTIRPNEVQQYKEIDEKIKAKLAEFIVN